MFDEEALKWFFEMRERVLAINIVLGPETIQEILYGRQEKESYYDRNRERCLREAKERRDRLKAQLG